MLSRYAVLTKIITTNRRNFANCVRNSFSFLSDTKYVDAGGFVDTACNFSKWRIGTATRVHWTHRTFAFTCKIDDSVDFSNMRAQIFERTPLATQCFAGRTTIFVSLFIPLEVIPLKSTILTFGLI